VPGFQKIKLAHPPVQRHFAHALLAPATKQPGAFGTQCQQAQPAFDGLAGRARRRGSALGQVADAVPWSALSLDTVNKRFTLGVPKDTLKDAPGFDKGHWPAMADKSWSGVLHKFYGTTDAGL
jgi:hypothetical protein